MSVVFPAALRDRLSDALAARAESCGVDAESEPQADRVNAAASTPSIVREATNEADIAEEKWESCEVVTARDLLWRVKRLIATKCSGERAPESLRQRLRVEISRTTIIRG